MIRRIILFFAFLTGVAAPASAHVGHVGELAGHSHWIGIGAIAAAAALAAIIAAAKKRDNAQDGEESEAEIADEGEEAAT